MSTYEDGKSRQGRHATSERTISPGMDHTNPILEKNKLYTGSMIPSVRPTGQVKRKWSPDHSDSSTGTLTDRTENVSAIRSGSSDQVSTRDPKRLKPCNYGDQTEVTFGAGRTLSLPGEMWQHIFTYLPPCSLGRLMCVSKVFRTLLTLDGRNAAPRSSGQGLLTSIEKERSWSISRRGFYPHMPRPMPGQSELEMWKLLRGTRCQFCQKRSIRNTSTSAMTPWTAGPGTDHIRMIWPFSVRSCSNCLRSRLQKETDLLFSSASALLPALPFAILTPSSNYIASVTLQTDPPPPGLQLTKWYFRPQVDRLKAKLDEVMALGVAAAEEWYKGLEADGRRKAADTARWEKWELTGGFSAIAYNVPPIRAFRQSDRETTRPSSGTSGRQGLSERAYARLNGSSDSSTVKNAGTCSKAERAPPTSLPPKPVTSVPASRSAYSDAASWPSLATPRTQLETGKTIQGVHDKKHERRSEIERRCAKLDPPIQPSTLALMDSFCAAIQIAMPLTEQAWDLLKPKLLMQHEAAEQQERGQLASKESLNPQIEEPKEQEAQSAANKENIDRQWEDSQKSVRERLENYADRFIQENWRAGDALTKSSCAQFAADLLLHVRHQFYAGLAQEDARMRSIGLPVPADLSRGLDVRKLTLENMRWVHERMVKPLTERFQKELFLCNECDNSGRYYSLESVVQHFAAKHTGSLSMGSAVVYWKAEWPELPPFDPNPTAAKAALYLSTRQASAPSSEQFSHNSSTPFLGPSTSHGTSPDHSTTSYSAGQPYPSFSQVNDTSLANFGAGFVAQGSPYRTGHVAQWTYHHSTSADQADRRVWPQQEIRHHTTNPYQPHPPFYPQGYQPGFGFKPSSSMPYHPPGAAYPTIQSASKQAPLLQALPSPVPIVNPTLSSQGTGIYQVHVQDLANIAKEIWDSTSGISNMQDSVRAQVIISHVDLRFKDKYTNEPNLALFTDGLNNIPQMSPIRSLSGLVCKACVAGVSVFGDSYQSFPLDRRMHTLPALLAHFRCAHVEHGQPRNIPRAGPPIARLDWKFDMIEMPDAATLRGLMYSPGITQSKLSLIANALPNQVPSSLPQVASDHQSVEETSNIDVEMGETAQGHDLREGGIYALRARLKSTNPTASTFPPPSTSENSAFERTACVQGDAAGRNNSSLADEAQVDEYDPHRPAFMNPVKHATLLGSHQDSSAGRPQRKKEVSSKLSKTMSFRSHGAQGVDSYRIVSSTAEHSVPQAAPQLHGVPGVDSYRIVSSTAEHSVPQAAPQLHGVPGVDSYRIVSSTAEHGVPEADPQLHGAQEVDSYRFVSSTAEHGVPEADPQLHGTLSDHSQHYPIRRTASFERAGSWPNEETWLVRADRRDGTVQQPLNDAEQFLRTINLPSASLQAPGERNPVQRLSSREGCRFDNGRSLDLGPSANEDDSRNDWRSRRSADRRQRIDDPVLQVDPGHEYRGRLTAWSSDRFPSTQNPTATSPGNRTPSRSIADYQPPRLRSVRNSPLRRSNSRFDRYEAQRQELQRSRTRSPMVAPRLLTADEACHRDTHIPQRPLLQPLYAADDEARYEGHDYACAVTDRPASQAPSRIRYVESPRYMERDCDREIEYVRLARRDPDIQESYYLRRPAANDFPDDHTGYEPSRPHDQVFERNGRLYTRAPPPPLDDRATYR